MPEFAGLLVYQYVSSEGKPRLYNEELQLIEAKDLNEAEEEYSRRIRQGVGEGIRIYKAFTLKQVHPADTGPTLLLSRRFENFELYKQSILISD